MSYFFENVYFKGKHPLSVQTKILIQRLTLIAYPPADML